MRKTTLFERALEYITVAGSLHLTDAAGRHYEFSGEAGPDISVRLCDPALNRKFLVNPWLYIGEAYMDGSLKIEAGTLDDVLAFLCINGATRERHPVFMLHHWLNSRLRRLQQYNPMLVARRNVARHYDLSNRLYELFLDSELEYSCGYFIDPDDTLEQAQENKKRHIAAKLLLEPGQKILDIGSGWGGLALYLARTANVDVTGITLSENQLRYAQERTRRAGLENRVHFFLRDFRDESKRYDRIVSIGMFEHVGVTQYQKFFSRARSLLKKNGILLLHSIFRMEPPGATNAWIRKYIFPGGYTPSLSESLRAIEQERLWVNDIEILRLHYATTLKHWHQRFSANRDQIADLYDERFCRMWEWYLKGCEMVFRYWHQAVFQMQISRQQEAVPLVRDYVTDRERGMATASSSIRFHKSDQAA